MGTLIGFLVVLLDLCLPLAGLVTGTGHGNMTDTTNNIEVQLRWGIASSLGLLLLPLSMIERIHNLAGCSFLSAGACMLTVMAVVVHAAAAIATHTTALHSVSDALLGVNMGSCGIAMCTHACAPVMITHFLAS